MNNAQPIPILLRQLKISVTSILWQIGNLVARISEQNKLVDTLQKCCQRLILAYQECDGPSASSAAYQESYKATRNVYESTGEVQVA